MDDKEFYKKLRDKLEELPQNRPSGAMPAYDEDEEGYNRGVLSGFHQGAYWVYNLLTSKNETMYK